MKQFWRLTALQLKLTFGIATVSYTHLDVYKRQAVKGDLAGIGRKVVARILRGDAALDGVAVLVDAVLR